MAPCGRQAPETDQDTEAGKCSPHSQSKFLAMLASIPGQLRPRIPCKHYFASLPSGTGGLPCSSHSQVCFPSSHPYSGPAGPAPGILGAGVVHDGGKLAPAAEARPVEFPSPF